MHTTTGQHGKSICRLLKSAGIDVGSYNKVRDELKASRHGYEVGKISVPDKKRQGIMNTAAWLRVTNVREVLQTATDDHAESGLLAWPPNVDASEIHFVFGADKGGGCTKLLATHICCHRAQSINNGTL